MSVSLIIALIATVALFATTAYFLFGSVPLLVLQHDTPMDARFVRGFFNAYYRTVAGAAGVAAAGYAIAGRLPIGVGAAALAVLALALRHLFIPRMEALGAEMQEAGALAISKFRRIHIAAIAINFLQLVTIVTTLILATRP